MHSDNFKVKAKLNITCNSLWLWNGIWINSVGDIYPLGISRLVERHPEAWLLVVTVSWGWSNSILSVTDLFPIQSHDVLCLMAPSLSSGSLNTSAESPVARQLPSWHTACPLVPAGHHHVLTRCFIPVPSVCRVTVAAPPLPMPPPYHCFVFVPCSRIEFVSWHSFLLESLCIPSWHPFSPATGKPTPLLPTNRIFSQHPKYCLLRASAAVFIISSWCSRIKQETRSALWIHLHLKPKRELYTHFCPRVYVLIHTHAMETAF